MMSQPGQKKDITKDGFNAAAADKRLPEMKLHDLLPTQLTVGMRQVEHKQKHLHELKDEPKKLKEFLEERPIPVVLGPGGKAYIIDHHHLALAMLNEGFDTARVQVVADFSDKTSQAEFWQAMEEKKYVHPYDEHGKQKPVDDIPKHLTGLRDDPYRALAGFVREQLGFAKVGTPFAEFQWADYFRKIIPEDFVQDHFHHALDQALKACRLPAASRLPGFIGKDGKPAVK